MKLASKHPPLIDALTLWFSFSLFFICVILRCALYPYLLIENFLQVSWKWSHVYP